MQGKLIKVNGEYILNPSIVGTKLSLKNCQAIENGYDLDELVHKFIGYDKESYTHVDEREHEAFINGFQKAIELLGDKKFNEEDIAVAYDRGQILNIKGGQQSGKNYVKSLQQTEWDVEIVMDICGDKVYAVPEPVLDADGCLILKKI